MNRKIYIIFIILLSSITLGLSILITNLLGKRQASLQTQSVAVKSVSSTISATGTIHSEKEVTLNFSVGGKLTYLPFKEGDTIQQGQTIASLDQRTLQKNLETSVKAYQNQQISFDTTNDFNGDRALSDTGLSVSARRQLETAANTLDQTQLTVDIQKIAQEQSILISPITGIVMHEDVTVPFVNITTATQFSVADPTMPVFRANISENDIDFVRVGMKATIQIDGIQEQQLQGIVTKIYPQKMTLSSGQQVYQVDIASEALKLQGKLQQSGTVLITSQSAQGIILVPAWAVISQKYIWIDTNGTPVLKQVTVGKEHGDTREILKGLQNTDTVITNPQSIAAKKYNVL